MNKFYGKVGYVDNVLTDLGVWEEEVTERMYYGDILELRRFINYDSNKINSDIKIGVQIDIVADQYAYEHFSNLKYVEYMGSKWIIESATPSRPRIRLNLGGLYSEQSH